MRNKEQFQKSISILINAYMNDTIDFDTTQGCYVGNLVAGWLNIAVKRVGSLITWKNSNSAWFDVCHFGVVDYDNYIGESKRQIDATGYTPEQLCKIESAGMNARYSRNHDEYIFNGLMAVVDMLCDIHEVAEPQRKLLKKVCLR